MITASRKGIVKRFSDIQWKNMPKHKFGWEIVSDNEVSSNIISTDIIQKKMIGGQVAAVKNIPDEIVIQKKEVAKEPAKDVIDEIKRKPGRQKE